MATKPSVADSRWAVDGSDVDATNIATPSGSQRDTGWVLNQVPPSSVENYLNNRAYRWFKYLSDGALSGNHTVDGSLQPASLTVGGLPVTFTSHTFTASSTTEELTVTAHGLATGDGPLQVSNSGGALPSPLVAATNYYAIVTGSNTFKLATSRLNALNGIAIDLTTNGTGTNSIVGVSATRAGNGTITGDLDATRFLPLLNAGYPASAADWVVETGAGAYAAGVRTTTVNSKLVLPLRLPVGAILSKVRFAYNLAAGGNSVLLGAGSIDLASGTVTEVNLFTDPTSTTWTTQDVALFATDSAGAFTGGSGSHVIRNDRLYWIFWNVTHVANTQTLGGALINPNP